MFIYIFTHWTLFVDHFPWVTDWLLQETDVKNSLLQSKLNKECLWDLPPVEGRGGNLEFSECVVEL